MDVISKMIITEFLEEEDYGQFGDWLRSQDPETLELYFGIAKADHVIDELMSNVLANPEGHQFLVAKDGDQWVGTIHIAGSGRVVEFGVIVLEAYRGHGIAGEMLEEALLWARNRGYKELFMHCLGWNKPIQHLCHAHGLETKNMYGDSEVEMKLPPGNWITLNKEICIKQRNIFHKFLQDNQRFYQEIYSI